MLLLSSLSIAFVCLFVCLFACLLDRRILLALALAHQHNAVHIDFIFVCPGIQIVVPSYESLRQQNRLLAASREGSSAIPSAIPPAIAPSTAPSTTAGTAASSCVVLSVGRVVMIHGIKSQTKFVALGGTNVGTNVGAGTNVGTNSSSGSGSSSGGRIGLRTSIDSMLQSSITECRSSTSASLLAVLVSNLTATTITPSTTTTTATNNSQPMNAAPGTNNNNNNSNSNSNNIGGNSGNISAGISGIRAEKTTATATADAIPMLLWASNMSIRIVSSSLLDEIDSFSASTSTSTSGVSYIYSPVDGLLAHTQPFVLSPCSVGCIIKFNNNCDIHHASSSSSSINSGTTNGHPAGLGLGGALGVSFHSIPQCAVVVHCTPVDIRVSEPVIGTYIRNFILFHSFLSSFIP